MKTTIFNKKALAFFGAAAILLAAVFTIGCKTDTGSGDPAPETFTVEMKAGEHGTLSANPVIPASGKVAKDTVITFSAAPASGYKVDKWTITGGTFESGTGTEGSTTAKVTITAKTKVSVSFKAETITPPSPTEFTVEMTAGEHGTLTANPVIPASGKVAKDTVITFTAAPASGYKVDKWTITGGTFETGTGTEGNLTAKVTITANTKVNVSFKTAMYTEVPFGTDGADLDNYLKTAVPDTNGICYIKVTGLTAADLKGNPFSNYPSRLGKILKDNPTKKVALKLSEVSGLTDMSYCFYKCENLTQAPEILSGVTNMNGCFSGCTSLTHAPEIPSGVTNMGNCFAGCTSLTQAPVIPSSVDYMSRCFKGCTSLTQAPVIPSNITYMKECFMGCKNLTQAPVIPSGVTNMQDCFFGCTSLTHAPEIPSGVTDMQNCFSGCKNLTQAPVIPSRVTNMNDCFFNCTSLTHAPEIPSGVTNMGSCFEKCTSLTQAPVIPSSVKNMSYCFEKCKNLTQAPVIPSSVTNMQACFYGCKEITAVTLKCNYNVAVVYGDPAFKNAFKECEKLSAGSIKVPAGQVQTYKDNAAKMGAQKEWFVAE